MAEQLRQAEVELEPIGRRAAVPVGATILDAAGSVGVGLVSACGGQGTCGLCRVRVVRGDVGPPSAPERERLTAAELAGGLRLACQAPVRGDVRIDILAESLSTTQRLQLEGEETAVELDPPVVALDVTVAPPALDDLRADATRLLDALAPQRPQIGLPVLAQLPERLRATGWSARVALARAGDERAAIVGIGAPGMRLAGLAIDLGTTKLAAYLVELETGRTLARAGALNPQIAHGEDVLSRIAYANQTAAARRALQQVLVDELNRLAGDLCREAGYERDAVVDCVVVGNTAMHHLFAGLPVRQLGQAPYVAAVSGALELRASEVGLQLAPAATLYTPPLIAGYVGADHVAMLLATGTSQADGTVLALDIGTNTEISLAHRGRLWSCSTASGPAFEGAHISNGMRAGPGAIERVHYRGEGFDVQTVDGRPPVGVCGSGILDAVAQSLEAGIVNRRGGLVRSHPLVACDNGSAACVLVPAARTGHHRDIVFTREDVGEIQLAKGAIRAGTELLLEAAGVAVSDLDEVVVAGAFGTYLDVRSAIRVGLLPALLPGRFRQVGNAAGAGARRLLLSSAARRAAAELPGRVQYLELTTHAEFGDHFAEAVTFT
jgi:uncharacterized 2Fe-2S/4Fe-4S cluster protein (DUF4445 family)